MAATKEYQTLDIAWSLKLAWNKRTKNPIFGLACRTVKGKIDTSVCKEQDGSTRTANTACMPEGYRIIMVIDVDGHICVVYSGTVCNSFLSHSFVFRLHSLFPMSLGRQLHA